MLVEPTDLTADEVLVLVRSHWDDGVVAAAHLPKGAGAHHWAVSGKHRPRWFVTADDVSTGGRLEELEDSYAAARRLAERGLYAVVPTVAPSPPAGRDDEHRRSVGVRQGRYLVTVTAYLEGESGPGDYADDNQRALIARELGALHSARAPRRTRDWRPGPPRRAELTELLNRLDHPWDAGPFGESVRATLQDKRTQLIEMLVRFDDLARRAQDQRASWVLTHGEPHTANVMWTPGGPMLVDWETLRVAPRERDLRTALRGSEGAEPLSAYVASGGTLDLDADLEELFDLERWLWEVCEHALRLSAPHQGDEDDDRVHRAFLEWAGSDDLR